jgi:hypothetical protein
VPPAYNQVPPSGQFTPEAMGAFPPGFYPGPNDPLVSANFSGWWTRSFRLLSVSWRQILSVHLIWAIPLLIFNVVSNLLPSDVESTDNIDMSDVLIVLAVAIPLVGVGLLLSMIAQLAALHVVVQRALGRPVSIGVALMAGLRRTPAMVGWGFLEILLVAGGVLLCVLPGIYVVLVLMILPAIILLERGVGIGRAFELFHADFGAAMARVGTILAVSVAAAIVENAFTAALTRGATDVSTVGMDVMIPVAIMSTVVSVASSVVTAPLILTAYADMRSRREPFSTAYLA